MRNRIGSAPGIWLQLDERIYIALPGVPSEMKQIFTEEVAPRLQDLFGLPRYFEKWIRTVGFVEAEIHRRVAGVVDGLPDAVEVGFYPDEILVDIVLRTRGDENKEVLEHAHKLLMKELGSVVYAGEPVKFEEVIKNLFVDRKKTLALAESCTGGNVSRRLTSIPGSSKYFKGSAVVYFTESKKKVLGIPPELIEKYGVYSREVASAMAERARELYGSDFAIGITGVAGPSGGDDRNRVGTVYIAVATDDVTRSWKFYFPGVRSEVIDKASIIALELLRRTLLGLPVEEIVNTWKGG